MDDAAAPAGPTRDDQAIDLSALEGIEAELQAVERALEQIDQGVYEGFAGLGLTAGAAPAPPADEPDVP